jgi:homoserine kinase
MPSFVTGPVRVRVPASSANLGPGFDSLGLALSLYDVITAEVTGEVSGESVGADGDAPVVISVRGEGAEDVPLDESHLVYCSMLRAFTEMGVPAPGVRLECENAIPHGRGLGSSSAAIVGGLCAARALVTDGRRLLSDDALFALAADIEGHPDNVAPAVYGGFTIAYAADGDFRAVRLEVTSPLTYVVFIPEQPLATRAARGLLPSTVPHAEAARNAGRAALLVTALTGRPDQLFPATEDWLHQPYRAPAMAGSSALVGRLRAAGHAAVISGAGPTVLAIVPVESTAAVIAMAPDRWRVHELHVDPDGARELTE